MKSITHQFNPLSAIIVAAICLLAVLIGVVFVPRAQAVPASGQRLITIHDGDQTKGVLTRATTLRQAFSEAHVAIDAHDHVEPSLDETLIASHYDTNIYRARPVVIADGAVRTKIMSPYVTAKQIAADAHITLQDEDIANMTVNDNMVSDGAGIQLTIKRATPFTLLFYGTKTPSYTQGTTVAEMLQQKKLTLGKDDTLSVPLDTKIQAGMTVELWRNGKQTATEEREVAFDIEKIQDADREIGYRQVKMPGIPGMRIVTYEIVRADDKEVGRTEIQSIVTKQPVKQVEIVGTKMTNTFSGSFSEALARLRVCESGGNYANKNNPRYRGAYQYDFSTWANYQGFYDPADAPPSVQDERAWQTYQRRGWSPWPSCSIAKGLQDIYR